MSCRIDLTLVASNNWSDHVISNFCDAGPWQGPGVHGLESPYSCLFQCLLCQIATVPTKTINLARKNQGSRSSLNKFMKNLHSTITWKLRLQRWLKTVSMLISSALSTPSSPTVIIICHPFSLQLPLLPVLRLSKQKSSRIVPGRQRWRQRLKLLSSHTWSPKIPHLWCVSFVFRNFKAGGILDSQIDSQNWLDGIINEPGTGAEQTAPLDIKPDPGAYEYESDSTSSIEFIENEASSIPENPLEYSKEHLHKMVEYLIRLNGLLTEDLITTHMEMYAAQRDLQQAVRAQNLAEARLSKVLALADGRSNAWRTHIG